MLDPTKHTELDHTLLAVAATMLKRLHAKRVEKFVVLRDLVRSKSFENDVLVVPALNFLFAIGLIEYLPKADLFGYRGPM